MQEMAEYPVLSALLTSNKILTFNFNFNNKSIHKTI
jgi:hypothetical protein